VQIGFAHGHCLPRAHRDRFEGPAVLAQRNLIVGAAVNIVEDRTRQATSCESPQITNVDNARQRDGALRLGWPSGHGSVHADRDAAQSITTRGLARTNKSCIDAKVESTDTSTCRRQAPREMVWPNASVSTPHSDPPVVERLARALPE